MLNSIVMKRAKREIMRRLVSSFIALYFSLNLFALEMPMDSSMSLKAQIGEFTVVEFPFKIKGVQSATFIPKYKIVKKRHTVTTSSALDNATSDVDGKAKKDTDIMSNKPPAEEKVVKSADKKKYISIKKGTNTLTLYPRKYGTLKLIVWGYEYPINLKIVVAKEGITSYYEIIDYTKKKKKVEAFESVPHEKVIVKLIRSMFNHKTPTGYDSETIDAPFSDQNITFTQTSNYIGRSYIAQEFSVTNMRHESIRLYEELFYNEGIYAVALEATDLKYKESTRLFIVKRNDKQE